MSCLASLCLSSVIKPDASGCGGSSFRPFVSPPQTNHRETMAYSKRQVSIYLSCIFRSAEVSTYRSHKNRFSDTSLRASPRPRPSSYAHSTLLEAYWQRCNRFGGLFCSGAGGLIPPLWFVWQPVCDMKKVWTVWTGWFDSDSDRHSSCVRQLHIP